MENKIQLNIPSTQVGRRKVNTSTSVVSSLPGSRSSSPSRSIVSKRAPFERNNNETKTKDFNRFDQFGSNSSTAVDGDGIEIEGEEDFIEIYNSSVEALARNSDKPATGDSLVQAFSRPSRDLKDEKATTGSKKIRKISNASDTTDRLITARHTPDYVTAFSKQSSTTEHDRTTISANEASENGKGGLARRSRDRVATRTKRTQSKQEDTSPNPEPRLSTTKQPYLPAYIQPVVTTERDQTATEISFSYIQSKQSVLQTSTVLMSDPLRKNDRSQSKRFTNRANVNRLSSSDSSNSEASTYSEKTKGHANGNQHTCETFDNMSDKPTTRQMRRTRHRMRNAQRSGYSATAHHGNNSIQSAHQPSDFPRKTNFFHNDKLLHKHEGKDRPHRTNFSRRQARTQDFVEIDERYSTLPADFKPDNVTSKLSTQKDQSRSEISKSPKTNTSQINCNQARATNELMITPKQILSNTEDVQKKSYISQTARPNQSTGSSSNQTNELVLARPDKFGIAAGRKDQIDITPPKPPQRKSKQVGNLRNFFNSEDVPKTEFGQAYNKKTSQLRAKVITRNVAEIPKPETEPVVHSQPMLKAVKLSEDFWPRDEATERLLNRNHVHSTESDKSLTNTLETVDEMSSLANHTVPVDSIGTAVSTFSRGLPNSPKETNLSDPVDPRTGESWAVHSRKTSASSTSSYQLQGQGHNLKEVSPHTSTETLQASVKSADIIESPDRAARSRSLDGGAEVYLPRWRYDDPDSKLKAFETETDNTSDNLESDSFRGADKRDSAYTSTIDSYQIDGEDLDIGPMRDIYLKGAPLYVSPKLNESSRIRTQRSLPESEMKRDNLKSQDNKISPLTESAAECSICLAQAGMSGGSNKAPSISTSTRKRSVVSQSTALPRNSTAINSDISLESADIDEGCFTEEDAGSRPSSMSIPPFRQVFPPVSPSRKEDEFAGCSTPSSRRRRKYSAAGQNNSDSSNTTNSSESSRSLSDPIPNRRKSLNGAEEEVGSVDSNFQYPLKPGAHVEEEKAIQNSDSELSVYSESVSNHDDFNEIQNIINEPHVIDDALADSKNSCKVMKKKSFSDPNANAVLTAGLIGSGDAEPDKASIYNSSSEPTLSEQVDESRTVAKKINYSKSPHSTGNSTRGWDNNGHPPGIGAMTQSIEEMSQSIYSDRHLALSPRSSRKVQSVKARNRAKQSRNSNDDEKLFVPIRTAADAVNIEVENALVDEEEKFQELFEIMSSTSTSFDNSSNMKIPVAHARSCSEPAVGDNLDNAMTRMVSERGRRAGIVQAPSLTDVLHKKTENQSNLNSSKAFSNSADRILSATIPRTNASHSVDYSKHRHEREHQDMRKHVVNNLLETERSYVNSLHVLHETYFKPLKRPENHSICEPRLVDEIFFQIPQILQHHQKFCANVQDCFTHWDPENIKMGDVFMQSFNKDKLLESYTSYIKNYLNAREAVNVAIATRVTFKQFLEQCQRENKEKQGLSDLMIKPVQRIPRYELIIKDLLKHTAEGHPDRASLLTAQQEIHALAVQMNKGEKDAEAADRRSRLLQEIEQLIEGSIDIAGTSKRKFLHQDICYELKNSANKKDRSLWLFNDMLMCTTSKKAGRSSSLRRSYMNLSSLPPDKVMIDYTCRYKFLWKFPLDDVDLLKGSLGPPQPNERQLEQLQTDKEVLQKIEELAAKLSIFHWQLDDCVRDLTQATKQRIDEKQQQSRQSLSLPGRLEIGIPTPDGLKLFQFEFSTEDSKSQFEQLFWEAKNSFTCQKSKWEPAFMKAIPISKTRNGMQFSCAAPCMETSPGTKEVWVCNTDGYVGQVCLLTLEPDPVQTLCKTVCKAKICCIAQVPTWDRKLVPMTKLLDDISVAPLGNPHTRRRSSSNSNPARHIISWDDSDESDEDNTSPISTMSNRSPYSTNTSVCNMETSHTSGDSADAPPGNQIPSMMHALLGGGAYKKDYDGSVLHGSLEDLLTEEDMEENGGKILLNSGSMWLGTEDGKVNIFTTADALRSNNKPCVCLNHSAPVQCILHHEGQVFVALSNGDLVIYHRDPITGVWEFDKKELIAGTSSNSPITKMVVVNEKELWCGCQNQIRIFDVKTHEMRTVFLACQDNKRQVFCMACNGFGVWIALDRRSQIKLFHSVTHELITEIDVSHPVNKMLASSDAIIRQHKAACLKITSLLVCKDLVWVGTSAGVVLTMALPTITATTSSLPFPVIPQGLPYGHTGHVRFLTAVDVMEQDSSIIGGMRSASKRRVSSASTSTQPRTSTLVISGGDGYEDFRMNSATEIAGREDSTNHLLVWKV